MAVRKIVNDIMDTAMNRTPYGYVRGSRPIGLYPLDLGFTLDREQEFYEPKDSDGIPQKRYASFGVQYNPTRIAAYALAHFNKLAVGEEGSKAPFLQMAEWFLHRDGARFEYHFPLSGLNPPWLSAMAQGEAISVLTRAHALVPQRGFLEQAVKAVAPLVGGLDEGGLRSKITGRLEFLEEYPLKAPPHTLNGFLYTLVGLRDLIELRPEIADMVGFDALLDSVDKNWRLWDLDGWSAYDLHMTGHGSRNFATLDYHRIHVVLMRYLGEVTGRPGLLEGSRLWDARSKGVLMRLRAIGGKIAYRLQEPAER